MNISDELRKETEEIIENFIKIGDDFLLALSRFYFIAHPLDFLNRKDPGISKVTYPHQDQQSYYFCDFHNCLKYGLFSSQLNR